MLRFKPSFSVSILIRWRKYISQLLNVHRFKDVRQKEIHAAEPHLSQPSAFEFQLAIEKLKSHKSTGIDKIPADLIKGAVKQFTTLSRNLFLFGKRRKGWKVSIFVPIYRKDDKADCNNDKGISLLPATHKIQQLSALRVNSICTGYYWVSLKWISMQQVNY